MKFSLALLSLASAALGDHIKIDSIPSNSELGKKLLSNARRLNDENAIDLSWLTGYDIKFQGCYETGTWNANANDQEDVRVMTKRLVRFRLCPSGSCDSSSASGCSSGYGDYLTDLNYFVDSWTEAAMQKQEYDCEMAREACGCGENDADDDEQQCEYNCYTNAGLSNCNNEEGQQDFNVQKYLECGQLKFNNRNRQLEDNVKYYAGPYCASQGGSIHLGIFTDETCTEPYDEYYGKSFYAQTTGYDLPYASQSMVSLDCKSCIMQQRANRNLEERTLQQYYDQNGNYVSELCSQQYLSSAKCESKLSVSYPNEYGCNFMEGIKVVRSAGTTTEIAKTPSKAASGFIGVFAVSFILLGAYVYYLKTKLDKAKINLGE